MKKYLVLLTFISLVTLISCSEPYALQTSNFEDALVVEATITNEMKHQEIKITKTYKLEEQNPTVVIGADVIVSDNLGNNYAFEEQDGIYVSTTEFQAQPNVDYKLKIFTNNGKSYSSTIENLTTINTIESLTPTVVTKNDGTRGIDMVVKSFDPTNTSKYYRYEYEEINKVTAPRWTTTKAIANYYPNQDPTPGYVSFETRTEEARICYVTKKSTDIILNSTNELAEDRVEFPVRFINKQDYIIAERYSMLVKQYVQNFQSYSYLKTLKELSGSDNVLSQNQPGFLNGNIKCDSNPNEKVVGYFNVSSVSTKRIFLNYSDVFPSEALPNYPFDCAPVSDSITRRKFVFKFCFDSLDEAPCRGLSILSELSGNKKSYFEGEGTFNPLGILYPIQCGDCNTYSPNSSNIRPTFWID